MNEQRSILSLNVVFLEEVFENQIKLLLIGVISNLNNKAQGNFEGKHIRFYFTLLDFLEILRELHLRDDHELRLFNDEKRRVEVMLVLHGQVIVSHEERLHGYLLRRVVLERESHRLLFCADEPFDFLLDLKQVQHVVLRET